MVAGSGFLAVVVGVGGGVLVVLGAHRAVVAVVIVKMLNRVLLFSVGQSFSYLWRQEQTRVLGDRSTLCRMRIPVHLSVQW